MDSSDALLAWTAYVVAALLLLLCLWRFTWSWRSRAGRLLALLFVAILLLLPARADPGLGALAPALFVTVFEYTMSADPAAGAAALTRLAIATGGLTGLAVAWFGWQRWRRGG